THKPTWGSSSAASAALTCYCLSLPPLLLLPRASRAAVGSSLSEAPSTGSPS
ncbi:hypothetical protein BHM03_00046214, partial [Ensete ventricosum]